MANLIGWALAGLVVGAIARLLMPGRQPMGILMTMGLGIAGALAGGLVSWIFTGGPTEPFAQHSWPGWLLSILGAFLILWFLNRSARRTAPFQR